MRIVAEDGAVKEEQEEEEVTEEWDQEIMSRTGGGG